MADFLERLIQGSDRHKVKKITGGYQVIPLDSSPDAVEAFQPVADDVLEHEGSGYHIHDDHKSSRTGAGELYDQIIILVDEEQ